MLNAWTDGRKVSVQLQCAMINREEDKNLLKNIEDAWKIIDRLCLTVSNQEKALELLSKKMDEFNSEQYIGLLNDFINDEDIKLLGELETLQNDKKE